MHDPSHYPGLYNRIAIACERWGLTVAVVFATEEWYRLAWSFVLHFFDNLVKGFGHDQRAAFSNAHQPGVRRRCQSRGEEQSGPSEAIEREDGHDSFEAGLSKHCGYWRFLITWILLR